MNTDLHTAKILGLKKAVPKGDKKRKKDVAAETARLEQDLQEKHELELETNGVCGEGVRVGELGGREREDEEGWKTVSDDDKPVKKSRAQKRKVGPAPSHLHTLTPSQEKKAAQERERQRVREEEEREMALGDNPRLRERDSLESLLERLQLSIIDIQPDGNW